jgi:hypothetical protein
MTWKNRADLQLIKCAKYKPGFSKCNECDKFAQQLRKKLDPLVRDQIQLELKTHLCEERMEREQYYSARAKACDRPDKYLSIILDAMDQKKTCVPFFLNPPKCLGSDYFMKTKVTAAIVHGHGPYMYWCTPEIAHDTNLSLECLRRTLLKYQQEKGFLPPVLYLQLDNAPDNKSKRFLAFIGFLIQNNIFKKIKLSYLVVGHTHEDVDGLFSAISRFFKHALRRVLTVAAFLKGLSDSFKKPPKCIERIEYCFDYSLVEEMFDRSFARFNLHEKTKDKIHYFVFWNDQQKGPVLQYKIYRYSKLLYPRKYMESEEHAFDDFGPAKVISTDPFRDPLSKEKFWNTQIVYKKEDGTEEKATIKRPANLDAIQIFYPDLHPLPSPKHFQLAAFYEKFDDAKRAELQSNIESMMEKCELSELDRNDWRTVLPIPNQVADLKENAVPFALPAPQTVSCVRQQKVLTLPVDTGFRKVDVVTHAAFRASARKRTEKAQEQELHQNGPLESLKKGDFVVLQVGITNCKEYPFDFVIAQVIADCSNIDTKNAETPIRFQVYRPSTLDNLASKMVPWIGDDNHTWKDEFTRGHVKALVQLQPQGKKLTANSRKMIEDTFF